VDKPQNITDLEKYQKEFEISGQKAKLWHENTLKLEGIVAYLKQKEVNNDKSINR